MFQIQRLTQCHDSERLFNITSDEALTCGTAADVSLRLHVSPGLPAYCARIWTEDTSCILQNTSGDPDLVRLNGTGVPGIVGLQPGDDLQVGADQFVVQWVSDDLPVGHQSTAATTEVPPSETPVIAEKLHLDIKSRELTNGVIQHIPEHPDWSSTLLLQHLCTHGPLIQFLNFRHAGIDVPKLEILGDDHFAQMPPEVSEISSLHTCTKGTPEDRLRVHQMLAGSDAEVWAVPHNDVTTALEQVKLYFAWFSRAQSLQMTLNQSPRDFCRALLKPFVAVFVFSPNAESWTAWSLDEQIQQILKSATQTP